MPGRHNARCVITLTVALLGSAMMALQAGADACAEKPGVCLATLEEIGIPTLRSRSYTSDIQVLEVLGDRSHPTEYTRHYTPAGATPHSTFLGTYQSDRLRLYVRLDIPSSAMPPGGFPLVVFAPGWISRDQAPGWNFGYDTSSFTGEVIQRFVQEGFAVVTPGYRGRGTVAGVAADGIEFIDAYGNGSYLSPVFYALDLLNIIQGLASLNGIEWQGWGFGTEVAPRFDLDTVALLAHSQGGDAALTALAVLGDNPRISQPVKAASIVSGNIPDRFTQANTFGPMGSTLQAFMSGDGTWTGSATGADGSVNKEFIFPWPADWIGTVDTRSPEWTWQAQQWATPTVRDALEIKYREMYDTLNAYVGNMAQATFDIGKDATGATEVRHDPVIEQTMPGIGGFNHARYLKTPLALHISDRDYYSMPVWNHNLARRINQAGGKARVFIYAGTNHSLKRSKYSWFSPPGTPDGLPYAIARDALFFRGGDPATIEYP